ncbi:ribonuclease Z [Thermaurantimonas aggregans]|uniref:Ribonuclease Z n=1 Tax=Thermaurantimonas aggregans TaxID=2173829 RepID=A0A401XKG5_9FLAO|nr:ribonuclease Z [Thermaurantimonas aggregans]MCX8149326.1 ribonuclease Z [Thermaurantimonas aggregans]GCD77474.1 ribonuclease Z [Thermaurantimonas aggregans]
MSLKITILGSSSATPTAHLFPTAQWLEIGNKHFLIDCGEGTQMQIRKNKLSFARLDAIFISHAHGDHCFGLLGLLSSLDLMKRQKELYLFAPPQIIDLVEFFFYRQSDNPFTYIIHRTRISMGEKYLLHSADTARVYTFPLKHTIDCQGFVFEEVFPLRNVNTDKIREYNIPSCDIPKIKKGFDWTSDDGHIIPNKELTLPLPDALRYAYCTDTQYLSNLQDLVGKVDILYHEATYAKAETSIAPLTGHSTSIEAAQAALQVEAKYLLIGHLSVRYKDPTQLLNEAREIFPNAFFARQNTQFILDRKAVQLHIVDPKESIHV